MTLAPSRGQLAALLLLVAIACGVARAEPAYVIDQLVVNVNSAPDASGERIATVKSGDRLEVLERSGDQVHVRLATGKDGWIRASYLSKDEPVRARLAERETDVAQLKDQVSHLESQLAAARASGAAPAANSAQGSAGTAGASGTAGAGAAGGSGEDPGSPPAGGLFAGAAEEGPQRLWPWALGAGLAGLGVGFALGALVLDRYIRRKYGGLRIY